MNTERIEGQVGLLATVTVILLAELLLVQQQYLSGILLYSLVLLALLLYGAYRWYQPQRQLLVLVIPSLIRLLDFTLPLGNMSPLFAQVVVAAPLVFTGIVFVWLFKQNDFTWKLQWRQFPAYVFLIVAGSVAGLLLYQFRQPERLTWNSPLLFFFYIFVILVAMAFLEEWLFRGIMQTGLTDLLGPRRAGLVVALVYAILHVNQGTWIFIAIVFLFAWGLSWLRSSSENLFPVCLVHGAANIMFFLVLPYLVHL